VEQLRSELLVGRSEWEIKRVLDERHVEYGINPVTGGVLAMVRDVEEGWVASRSIQISMEFDGNRKISTVSFKEMLTGP